jgi:hypothetical protein
MKRGVPPTERKARTGEFTPPGMVRCARSKRVSFLDMSVAGIGLRSGARRSWAIRAMLE